MLGRKKDIQELSTLTPSYTRQEKIKLDIGPDDNGNIKAQLTFLTQIGTTFFYYNPITKKSIASKNTQTLAVTADLTGSPSNSKILSKI